MKQALSPFTIVLPVHNGGSYVNVLIDSLLAQTDPDWQLIVLENASTDGTVERIRRYGDERILIRDQHEFMDIYENWHRALDVARQLVETDPLMTFIGHDDWLYPQFVARAKALACTYPEASLYQLPLDLVDARGAIIRPGKPVPVRESWSDMAAALAWNFRDSVGTGYVCRARDYVAVGGMPKFPRILHGDHLLWLRLARRGGKASDTEVSCAYRIHVGSTSGGMSSGKINDQLEAYALFVETFLAEFPSFTDSDRGRNAMQTWIGRELYLFQTAAVRRRLTKDNLTLLERLRERTVSLGGQVDPAHWSFQGGGRLHRALRNIKLRWTFRAGR